jgi:hypothetical protein
MKESWRRRATVACVLVSVAPGCSNDEQPEQPAACGAFDYSSDASLAAEAPESRFRRDGLLRPSQIASALWLVRPGEPQI